MVKVEQTGNRQMHAVGRRPIDVVGVSVITRRTHRHVEGEGVARAAAIPIRSHDGHGAHRPHRSRKCGQALGTVAIVIRKKNFHEVKQRSTDAEAFRAAVRDVTPLAQTPSVAGLATPRTRARRRKDAAPPADDLPLVSGPPEDESAPAPDTVTGGEALSFPRAGVRIQVMRRLRRGFYPIDDELDLHGLSQTAARGRLAEFIADSRNRGGRCVRIIHGKGHRSGARGPVLKTAVNLWLRRLPDVMAFVSARAMDGGAGAVYVLLRA